MSFMNFVKDQFIDVIEHTDDNSQTIVTKYKRPNKDNDEIKTGARVIVRPSQAAVFFKGGQFADIFEEGTYKLDTDNLPVLSTLMALPHMFNSPIKADLYFICLRQFVGNKWNTKNPLIIRDEEFRVIRIKSFGTFSFKIIDTEKFVREILGTQRKFETSDIVDYLSSFLVEAFSVVLNEVDVPILDLSAEYTKLAKLIQLKSNLKVQNIGIEFSDVIIENISLPKQVEEFIDEQSGIGMASRNMKEFIQYQSARAIRDAASQSDGIAGLGASVAIGEQIARTMSDGIGDSEDEVKVRCSNCGTLNGEQIKYCSECGEPLMEDVEKREEQDSEPSEESNNNEIYEKLVEYKKLLDDGILTQDEYDEIKKQLLNK